MSELIDLPLLELGPRIAIIDDKDEDARPIELAFDDLHVGNQYFNVDMLDPQYPAQPLKDVEMVFLDLHYNEGFGAAFDPYLCINWLNRIVPAGRKYILVVWSRDIDLTGELMAIMTDLRVTIPYYTFTKSKQQYRIADNQYDIPRLLDEVGVSLKQLDIEVMDFYGNVLEIEEEEVLINCLINEDPKVFEVRRFDLQPFRNYMQLYPGQFLRIKITTKPGSRVIEFLEENNDLSQKFIKPDSEEDFGSIDWLNTPEDENNV
jgi:hypothetical protein